MSRHHKRANYDNDPVKAVNDTKSFIFADKSIMSGLFSLCGETYPLGLFTFVWVILCQVNIIAIGEALDRNVHIKQNVHNSKQITCCAVLK